MNKFAKGSLAAGAGLVLLLGGAGTLAYWNDSAELAGGTISTGTMTLTEESEGTWAPELTKLVPGDTTSYKSFLRLDAEGTNIKGTIELDPESIKYTGGTEGVTSAELKEKFDLEVDFGTAKISGGGSMGYGDESADIESLSFDGAGTYRIPVTVTVTLPDSADNTTKDAQINIDDLSFIAKQTQTTAG